MYGFSDSAWLDAIEQKLDSVSSPLIEVLQNSYSFAKDKYPNITVVGACIVAFGILLKRCMRNNQNKKQKKLEHTVKSLAKTATKQATAFRSQVEVLGSFRENLNEIRSEMNYQTDNNTRATQTLMAFQKNLSTMNQSMSSISSNLQEQNERDKELADLKRLNELKQNSQRVRKKHK